MSSKRVFAGAASSAHDIRKMDMNPFVNQTRTLTCFQKIKIAIMCICMVPLIRLILIFICLILIWLITKLALLGFHPIDATTGLTRPMGCCRKAMLTPARWLIRAILFIFGVVWISEKYAPGTSCCWSGNDAPIMVCNHVSFFDALYFGCRFLPAAVAKSDVANYPIVGSIIKAMQPILVYRNKNNDGPKRKGALAQIMERVQQARTSKAFPPILIFPEGTTHNTKALTMFKRGAFVPAAPVQPVTLKYPFCFHDVSWTPDSSLVKIALVSLCQVYQRIEVEYLPVYTPQGKELTDPALYGRNVRALMAKSLNVPVTNHAYDDVKLLNVVSTRYGLQHIVPVMNVADAKTNLRLDYTGLSDLLKRFRAADKDNNGSLALPEFCEAMQLDPNSEYARRLFDCVDTDGNGSVDFRETVLGLSFAGDHGTEEKLRMAFAVYDTNNDGFISQDELRKVLTTVRAMDEALADHEVHDVMTRVATNEDGNIDFAAFQELAEGDSSFLSLAIDMARMRAGLAAVTPKVRAEVAVDVNEEHKHSADGVPESKQSADGPDSLATAPSKAVQNPDTAGGEEGQAVPATPGASTVGGVADDGPTVPELESRHN